MTHSNMIRLGGGDVIDFLAIPNDFRNVLAGTIKPDNQKGREFDFINDVCERSFKAQVGLSRNAQERPLMFEIPRQLADDIAKLPEMMRAILAGAAGEVPFPRLSGEDQQLAFAMHEMLNPGIFEKREVRKKEALNDMSQYEERIKATIDRATKRPVAFIEMDAIADTVAEIIDCAICIHDKNMEANAHKIKNAVFREVRRQPSVVSPKLLATLTELQAQLKELTEAAIQKLEAHYERYPSWQKEQDPSHEDGHITACKKALTYCDRFNEILAELTPKRGKGA